MDNLAGSSRFTLEQGASGADPQRMILRLAGEMDVMSGSEVSAAIHRHLDMGRSVVVDLTEVTFMDSSGVAAILKAARDESERAQISIVPSRHNQPARLASLTGMDQYFVIESEPVPDRPR